MVDVLALSTNELVSAALAGLAEALTYFTKSETSTAAFRALPYDFTEVWVFLDAEQQGVVHKIKLTKHLGVFHHGINDVFAVFLFKVQPEVLRVHVQQVHVLQGCLGICDLSFDNSFD